MMGDEERSFRDEDEGTKIGALLERTRKKKGLSLQEVEQATKIRKRYIEGLEQDDYGALPDAVYVQGFLKTYANYLGLDGEELSGELRSRRRPRKERQLNYEAPRQSQFEQPIISPGGLTGTHRRRVSGTTVATILISVLILAAVIGALYLIGLGSSGAEVREPAGGQRAANISEDRSGDRGSERGDKQGRSGGDQEKSASPEESTARTAAKKNETTGGAEEEKRLDVVEVLVSVEGAPSWLQISADGTTVYSQVAQPGFSETFEGERAISISTGNAGAVRVEVNGQDLGVMGANGEVLTEDFRLKDAS
jgi:cytoskeleton protein RodZ